MSMQAVVQIYHKTNSKSYFAAIAAKLHITLGEWQLYQRLQALIQSIETLQHS